MAAHFWGNLCGERSLVGYKEVSRVHMTRACMHSGLIGSSISPCTIPAVYFIFSIIFSSDRSQNITIVLNQELHLPFI